MLTPSLSIARKVYNSITPNQPNVSAEGANVSSADLFCRFSDGTAPKYDFPLQDRGKTFRTIPTKRFHESLIDPKKERHARVDAWTVTTAPSGAETRIVGAFCEWEVDVLSWKFHGEHLTRLLHNVAVVGPTISGGIAALVPLELPVGQSMNINVANDSLPKAIPEELFELRDGCAAACQYRFLTEGFYQALQTRLHTINPTVAVISDDKTVDSTTTFAPSYQGALPAEFKFLAKDVLRERFIRLLAVTHALAGGGWEIPTTRYARVLGTNPTMISRMRRELENAGLLQCMSQSYIPGLRAKRYVALGALKTLIEKNRAAYKPGKKPLHHLPTTIENGTWNHTLFQAAGQFFDEKSFLSWVRTMSGWDAKRDRIKMAARAIRRRIDFRNKLLLPLAA